MDRRIQKTRQAIMNTFVDLLTEKGFNKITINGIADRASINRGYRSKTRKQCIFKWCNYSLFDFRVYRRIGMVGQ